MGEREELGPLMNLEQGHFVAVATAVDVTWDERDVRVEVMDEVDEFAAS